MTELKPKWDIVLSTTEPFCNIGLIKLRKNNENSETVRSKIVQNNVPYNLSNKKVFFCAYYDKFTAVEQEAVVTNSAKGEISYTLNKYDMQGGLRFAYFRIVDNDGSVDSTQNFSYKVNESIESSCINAESYILRLEQLLNAFGDVKDQSLKEIQEIIKSFNEQIILQQESFENWFEPIREIIESVDPGGLLLSELINARDGHNNLKDKLDEMSLETATVDDKYKNLRDMSNNVGEGLVYYLNKKMLNGQAVHDFINNKINERDKNETITFYLPAGGSEITGSINLDSNVNIYPSQTETSIINLKTVSPFIGKGEKVKVGNIVSMVNDSEIKVSDTTEIKVGDYIEVKSSIDALSQEAGKWNLGVPTGAGFSCFLGEIVHVEKIDGNTVTLSGKLTFDIYSETSTVSVIKFIENVTIGKLTFISPANVNVFTFDVCRNIRIFECTYAKASDGHFVAFKGSLQCVSERNIITYRSDVREAEIYKRNAIKLIACQQSQIKNNDVYNASQAIDLSFTEDTAVNISNSITDNNIYEATTNPITTHAGNIYTVIANNNCVDCKRNGIAVRGLNTLVTHNTILKKWGVAQKESTSYGISIFEEGARDNRIDGNTIDGFENGVSFYESSRSRFKRLDTSITNNNITNCFKGIFFAATSAANDIIKGIIISGNFISTGRSIDGVRYHFLIDTQDNLVGITIANNTFEMSAAQTRAIRIKEGMNKVFIVNNTLVSRSSNIELITFVGDEPAFKLIKNNSALNYM